jgi:hypothetical protein
MADGVAVAGPRAVDEVSAAIGTVSASFGRSELLINADD